MNEPKIFIGPMSLNVIDSVIEFSNNNNIKIGLIPSRRQIDYDSGYVNNWTTEQLSNYVKTKTNDVLLVRDHGGPSQGKINDDGFKSLENDCKVLDIIHIDPWKKYPNLNDGIKSTIQYIEYCYNLNPNIKFEVGTEEAIRPFNSVELETLLDTLEIELTPQQFNQISYVVVQSGTGLDLANQNNTGNFDLGRLIDMCNIVKSYGKLSKEHNGDYLNDNDMSVRFNNGLDAINIAPEYGQIETRVYLDLLRGDEDRLKKIYELSIESGKWEKWLGDYKLFTPEQVIMVCGHYMLSNEEFINITSHIKSEADDLVNLTIINKLKKICKL